MPHGYDGLVEVVEKDNNTYAPCEVEFVDSEVANEYDPRMCGELIQYGREGLLIEGFVGKYNINQVNFNKWITAPAGEYEELKAAKHICLSACIHVWSSRLNHAVKNCDWQAVANIKSIIADIMKSIPKHFREGLSEGYAPEDPEEKKRAEKIKQQNSEINALGGSSQDDDATF